MADRTGTADNDRLNGTEVADTVGGLSGSDTLNGLGGNDRINGGDGGDRIDGGDGDDLIFGFGASDRQAGSGDIVAERVGSGLSQPLYAISAPGDPDRLFVVEKGGQIEILDPATGVRNSPPFLTIPSGELQTSSEQGLLGLAFHPDYEANGRFFVFLVNAAGNLEVRQYERSSGNPDIADASSGDVILTIPHPTYDTHNGGWMAFGPDGYLYIATGDGGSSNDSDNNAQNVDVLLGKMLRIDVDGDDFAGDGNRDYAIPDDNPFANGAGADEIWAVGLRNPWRPSFDRLTGDLYIADVGRGRYEEVNFQDADSEGGVNYGWTIREGAHENNTTHPGNLPPDSDLLTDPLIEYTHDPQTGGYSVTGGYVYRGTTGGMQGVYFYADFVTDRLWSFRVVNGEAVDAADRTAQLEEIGGEVDSIASFGEDGRGNLYIVGLDGEVFRMTPGEGAGDGADVLRGGDGNDTIYGGALNDTLDGGAGRDRLHGGRDQDVFDFNDVSDSTGNRRDTVLDFTVGEDVLDLRTIDARAGTAGNQRFEFIGTGPFTGEGQVRVKQVGDDVLVQANTSAGDQPEMQVRLIGVDASDLTAGDFVL